MKNIITFGLAVMMSVVSLTASAKENIETDKNTFAVSVSVSNSSACIKWSSMDASNVESYVIEKSVDGVNFNFVQAISALQIEGISSYMSMKVKITKPTYFRIAVKTKTGETFYVNPMTAQPNN
jgi:hypothetical protein